MTYTDTDTGAMVEGIPGAALESRASVESLEALHEERRALLPRFAALAAKFKGGNSASADTKRKQHRALVAKRIQADSPDVLAENKLERMANADLEHIAFCDTMEREFTEYVLLEYRITEIQERIRNRETCLNVYNAELRLAR